METSAREAKAWKSTGLAMAGVVAMSPRRRAEVMVEKCMLTEGLDGVNFRSGNI